MVTFREKSKSINKKNKKKPIKTTLDHKHGLVLNNFRDKESEIPKLNKELSELNKKYEKFKDISNSELNDRDLESKIQLKEEINEINKLIEDIQSQSDMDDYLLDTSHMLFHYFDEENDTNNISVKTNNISSKNKSVIDFFKKGKPIDTHETKEKKPIIQNNEIKNIYSDKKDIMNKYFSIVNPEFVPTTSVNQDIDLCPHCNESRIFDSIHGILHCPKCGCEEKILIDSDTPSYKEPPREITYFAYKKINHANEFLSQFQAKESTDIDNIIFERILDELKKEAYIDISNITPHKIREILKKLELTKYYEHCHYITNRLTGKPAPTLTTDLEEKLRNMFKEVQGPWMNYCPNERANFFSYPYIFYKFFQLLDKDEYLPYCRLLKSREKLQEHDEVWKRICKHLRWQFIPTV